MAASFRKACFGLSFLILWVFSFPTPAFCHRINVFCWVEGSHVRCQAKFTPGGPVKRGKIAVYSQQTRDKLLTVETDDKGEASFEIPRKAIENHWDLKVICNAEMGHKNYWIVRASELLGTESQEPLPEQSPAASEPLTQETRISDRQLEEVVSRVLERELAPIKKDLAELKQNRITVQDVLGGLGYILGLVGIAFYLSGKKEKRG
ncbi:MAG: hypothetical protein DRH12_02165 [Deltaproteobacteria bacterium]|nr:MAG: hypothetical protein DRH12_02165 [Deltaproteobacteria bacterium]